MSEQNSDDSAGGSRGDILAVESLNQAITSALKNHTYLSNKICAQKTKLLKEKMAHALELAHHHSESKLQEAVRLSSSSCRSATEALHGKIQELDSYIHSVRSSVSSMKKKCSELQQTAENTIATSSRNIKMEACHQIKNLEGIHGSIQGHFLKGLKDIFSYKERMKPSYVTCTGLGQDP